MWASSTSKCLQKIGIGKKYNVKKQKQYKYKQTTQTLNAFQKRALATANVKKSGKKNWLGLGLLIVASGFVVFEGINQVNKYLDSLEEPEKKEKVVVLGSGWAALSLLSQLNRNKYDVTVVSPRNYFLFTPLLADVAVGTIDAESIMEPIRSFLGDDKASFRYYEASATDIDPKKNTVTCRGSNQNDKPFTVEYDKLIMAVGAVNNNKKVKGADTNALSLRDYEDARKIRNRIIDNVETAITPGTTEEEKRRLLHFVVIGGGPVAAELAADLHDYFNKNNHVFPDLKEYINITVVETTDHINNYYDKSISRAMKRHFTRPEIKITDSEVVEIGSSFVVLKTLDAAGKEVLTKVPCGMTVWSAGIAVHPLVEKLRVKIPEHQQNSRALVTDKSLSVLGAENIYALGDCATVDQEQLLAKWAEVFAKADTDKSGAIDISEFESLVQDLSHTYPALRELADRAKELFSEFDTNKDNQLSQDEFKNIITSIERNLTRFPSTATVAVQQGQFLGKVFNKFEPEEEGAAGGEEKKDDKGTEDNKDASAGKDDRPIIRRLIEDWKARSDAAKSDEEKAEEEEEKKKEEAKKDAEDEAEEEEKPEFRYKHIGGFEYVGAEDGFVERGSRGSAIVKGPGAMWMWRTIYFSKLVNMRIRSRIVYNMFYYRIFGRTAPRI